VREGYVQAFADSLDTVFLAAVPFALLAFALTWFLEEVPLRKTVESSGVGESLAMPREDSSLKEIERALSVLVSRDSKRLIYERLARRAGVDLSPAGCWLLLRLDEHGPVAPAELADRLDVPEDRLGPHFEELREAGLVAEAGDGRDGEQGSRVTVSSEGRHVLDRLLAARRQGLAEMLEGWSPEQHEELARLLGRLARELLRDDPEPGFAGAGLPREP
jgi:DNA-binding MarR family transcriptional regulator